MNNYQAIYDAVRDCNLSHHFEMAAHALVEEHSRPSALYKPSISIDGNQWCALYGENLQDGVAGFGGSPSEAMRAFDLAWNSNLEANQSNEQSISI